jgi:hypothetical protein
LRNNPEIHNGGGREEKTREKIEKVIDTNSFIL